jgi:dethiobiotin synthetase
LTDLRQNAAEAGPTSQANCGGACRRLDNVPENLGMHTTLSGLVVTGTDTGVGKTHVATLVVRALRRQGLRVGAYKPVCSGATCLASGGWEWDDLERLRRALTEGADSDVRSAVSLATICPQRFLAPLAPPVAARYEGRQIDEPLLVQGVEVWRGRVEAVVIEGVGGWLCPVTEDAVFADLAAAWHAPVLVVARRGLGTINHTLLTIESIRRYGLPIAGVILNEPSPAGEDLSVRDNAVEIARRGGVPVLGELEHGADEQLRRAGQPITIKWFDYLGPVDSRTWSSPAAGSRTSRHDLA